MQRRQVVRAIGLLAAGTAGCSEAPSPTPAPPQGTPGTPADDGGGITTRRPLRVTDDYTWSEGPDGNVLLDLTVTNPARVRRVATLRISAGLDGEEIERRKRLELASGESMDLSFTIGFDYDAWQNGSISLDFAFDYLS